MNSRVPIIQLPPPKEFLDLPQTKFVKTYEIVEHSHVAFADQYRAKSLSLYADKHVSTFQLLAATS